MTKQEKNTKNTESQDIEQQEDGLKDNFDKSTNDLEREIQKLSGEIEILQDKLLRQMAESENIRTRSSKLVDEAREYAILGFAKDLVSAMDNLSRALEHLPEQFDDNIKNVVEGIQMTKKEFGTVFKKHLLESIEPQAGDKYDHHSHHAISQVVTDKQKPGTIVSTMQMGYRIKDRLIRPAAVTVAKSDKN